MALYGSSRSTSLPSFTPGKEARHKLNRRLGEPHRRSGHFRKIINQLGLLTDLRKTGTEVVLGATEPDDPTSVFPYFCIFFADIRHDSSTYPEQH